MSGKVIVNQMMNLVFVDNHWMITDPWHNQAVQLDQALNDLFIEILTLCRNPYTVVELIDYLCLNLNLSKSKAEQYIAALLQNNILTPVQERKANHCLEIEKYLGFRYSVTHADYSDSQIFKYDKNKMQNYQSLDAHPMPSPIVTDKPQISLGHPAYAAPVSLSAKLAALLFYAFGCVREATFLEFLPVLLKCAPSKGARHPFDVYLMDAAGILFDAGHYYYCPQKHCLYLWSDKRMTSHQNNNIKLQIVLNFERYQWRYRHSWAYKDVFFDLGHIIELLKSAAVHLGLVLSNHLFYEDVFLNQNLREECCFTCEISAL